MRLTYQISLFLSFSLLLPRFTFLFLFLSPITIYLRMFLQTASNLRNLTISPLSSFPFSFFLPFFFFFNNLRKFFIQIPFNLPSLHLISPFASTFPPSPSPLYFIRSVCLLTGKKFSIFASRCVHTHRPYANRSLSLILEEHFGSIPPVQR